MTDQAIHFESVSIQRIEKRVRAGEGFELAELSPSVNLIFGPNGSGKSTSALAIQELLWPCRTGMERPSVQGKFRDGAQSWFIDIDAGHAACTCDGVAGAIPSLGPAENRRRYHFALDELIQKDDANFAASIARESQGGYDLSSVAEALGFRQKPKSCKTQRDQVQKRRAELETALAHQREIESDAAKLDEFIAEHKRAVTAQTNLDLLQKALEFKAAEEEWSRLKRHIDAIPGGIALLHGDEREKLNDLTTRRKQFETSLASEQQCISQAEKTLSELCLPDDGVDKVHLEQLRAWQRELSGLESEIRQHNLCIVDADAETSQIRKRLSKHIDDNQLASLQTVEVPDLSKLARRTDRLKAEEAVLRERHNWLKKPSKNVPAAKAETIWEGVSSLSSWLASPKTAVDASARFSWVTFTLAAIAVLLSIVLAAVRYWAWLLIGLLAIGLFIHRSMEVLSSGGLQWVGSAVDPSRSLRTNRLTGATGLADKRGSRRNSRPH